MSMADSSQAEDWLLTEEAEETDLADGGQVAPVEARKWRILVVDDDEDVHETTRFALKNAKILNRPIELLHAYSAAEGKALAAQHADIAVALIDVVMETPDAGLRLVESLRADGFSAMRIVLRTGQPGYAPEISVIASYEIDDYRPKAELTRTRLLTVLTAAIRAFDQICTIARSRAGLELIVQSTTKLMRRTNVELLSLGILTQIAGLLGVATDGLVCVAASLGKEEAEPRIVSAAGKFSHQIGRPLSEFEDMRVQTLVRASRGETEPVLMDGFVALNVSCESGRELTAVIEAHCDIAESDRSLLMLFSSNIAIAFENMELIERLDQLAFIDQVLQVPNLNAFENALAGRLEGPEERGRVALLDVDSYRTAVAANGPPIAHAFLEEVYRRLLDICPAKIFVARVGDGTFGLLGDPADLDAAAIATAFARPYRIEGIEIATTATAALLDFEGAGGDPAAVMRRASSALLHVKGTRPGESVVCDASMQSAVERRLVLESGLKQAINSGKGLSVHMQPKIELSSGKVIGAEALARWHFEGEAISPVEFIPIAEATGLVETLTDFVVDTVGSFTRQRKVPGQLSVAVNLSMVDLNTPGFARRLLERVPQAGLCNATLEFEVTEGIAMQGADTAIEQTRSLRDAGFRIALDDFGTGYSSLGNFSKLPIDILKIDRSFVSPLTPRTARSSLAAIVLAMAETMNVACVAEGIETLEQKQALDFLGCQVGQGYYFGRPVPIEEFDELFPQNPS